MKQLLQCLKWSLGLILNLMVVKKELSGGALYSYYVSVKMIYLCEFPQASYFASASDVEFIPQ